MSAEFLIGHSAKINLIVWMIIQMYFHFAHPLSLTHSNENPSFDDINPRNLTVVIDDTAVLKCRVKNKGNRTVSWIRKRDLHILTTNIYTYTGDQRFSVLHSMGSDDWDLKINYVQPRDSGIYECQVNTEPKINLALALFVTEKSAFKDNLAISITNGKAARAKILGSSEIHVKRESTIALSCTVNTHASNVLWYHGSSVVDFDSSRGGISLETEKTDLGTTSRLMLTRATFKDSGNYTCYPSGALPASVRVHILTGEQPAAMQTSQAMSINRNIMRTVSSMLAIYSCLISLVLLISANFTSCR